MTEIAIQEMVTIPANKDRSCHSRDATIPAQNDRSCNLSIKIMMLSTQLIPFIRYLEWTDVLASCYVIVDMLITCKKDTFRILSEYFDQLTVSSLESCVTRVI